MNAAVRRPRVTDDAVLRLLVEHPPMTVSGVARFFGWSDAAASLRVTRLKALGWIESGRGSCAPTPAGLSRAGHLREADGPLLASQLRLVPDSPALAPPPLAQPEEPRAPAPVDPSMEPRGSIAMSDVIAALESAQDPLLVQANAQLRLRVSELEARVAELEARQAKTLLRLAYAADALTG